LTPALSVPRPKRITTASSKLLDASNIAAPTLSSHRQAIEARRQAEDATDQADQHEATPQLSVVPVHVSTDSTPKPSSPATDRLDDCATEPTPNSDSEVEEVQRSKSSLD